MTYDKNSFLAGVAVGETLKGWASAQGGGSVGIVHYRVGASTAVVSSPQDAAIEKMRSATLDYIVPCDSSGNDIKPVLNQPFEIGCRFSLLANPSLPSPPTPYSGRNIFGASNNYYQCPAISVSGTMAVGWVTSVTGSWSHSIVLTPSGWRAPLNTPMQARVSWDGTDFELLFNDGAASYIAKIQNVTQYYNANYSFEFGGQNKSTYSIAASGASVFLDGTYLQQGSRIMWGKK